jgi:hypothetical protein
MGERFKAIALTRDINLDRYAVFPFVTNATGYSFEISTSGVLGDRDHGSGNIPLEVYAAGFPALSEVPACGNRSD